MYLVMIIDYSDYYIGLTWYLNIHAIACNDSKNVYNYWFLQIFIKRQEASKYINVHFFTRRKPQLFQTVICFTSKFVCKDTRKN